MQQLLLRLAELVLEHGVRDVADDHPDAVPASSLDLLQLDVAGLGAGARRVWPVVGDEQGQDFVGGAGVGVPAGEPHLVAVRQPGCGDGREAAVA